MAVSDANINDSEKSAKESQKGKEKKEKPLTKIVIRRLPPSMDYESFLMQVSPVPDYDYIYIVKGDMSLGENAYARVYINFVNAADIFMFKEKFDNYVFVDQKGHEYPAVVEFAAFQKIPRKRKPRPDPKTGTIESDSYYQEFLELLKEQPNQDVKPEFSYQFSFENKEEVASTPLLDYIKQRRIDKQRIREERREERKRKELERKKLREDERKRHDMKSPSKTAGKTASSRSSSKYELDSVKEETTEKSTTKSKTEDEKEESTTEKVVSPSSASKDKFEDRKPYVKSKPRFPPRSEKPDYLHKKTEYKSRRDDYREKEYRNRRFEDYKEIDTKQVPRRTKKYSEKREERKNEARKAEQKKVEEEALEKVVDNSSNIDIKIDTEKNDEKNDKTELKKHSEEDNENQVKQQTLHEEEFTSSTKSEKEIKYKSKEYDPRIQRRIRNKDRPTMAIYQPGMLSKRKTVEGTDVENKE